MHLFRKLADTIIFKIILAFVILTFVLFGISGFLLGKSDNWVAKVGNESIGYDEFFKTIQNDKKIILANSRNSIEAQQYVESERFKGDVLGRLLNKKISQKLTKEYGFEANKDLILQSIVSDPSFENKGKFDKNLFEQFLSKHSLDEAKYIDLITDEIISSVIIQSVSAVAPINENNVLELANLAKEERIADIIKITKNQLPDKKISDSEIANFYENNKEKYLSLEYRKVSFVTFSKENFADSLKISDEEIKTEYEKNQNMFVAPESREFYHIVFGDEAEAKEFLQELEKTKNLKNDFAKLAKSKLNKDITDIELTNITKEGFLPELSNKVFSYKINELSEVIKSPLGFHIFLTNKIIEKKPLTFVEAKKSIKANLSNNRESKILEQKISEINDIILETNSLEAVVDKLKLANKITKVEIDKNGLTRTGEKPSSINNLGDFATHAFDLNVNQTSQIFYTKDFSGFYILKVENIDPSKVRKLSDIKNIVQQDFLSKTKNEDLKLLANKIANEIFENPKKSEEIAKKYQASYIKNQKFINSTKELNSAIFNLRKGEVSKAILNESNDYEIAILNSINSFQASSVEFSKAKNEAIKSFRNKIMTKYNEVMMEKNPISINEQFFKNN